MPFDEVNNIAPEPLNFGRKAKTTGVSGEQDELPPDEFLKGFEYEGITDVGRVKMPAEAPSERDLRKWLAEAHIEVTGIKKKTGKVSRRSKVKDKDIADFVGMFATRKQSGQGDIEAIQSCSEATENVVLRRALKEIVLRIESGTAPDKAFEQSKIYNPKKKIHTDKSTFPKEFIHTVRAGRRGSAVVLLKDYERRLRQKIDSISEVVSELIYPAITIVLALILSGVMIFVILPQFKPLFEGLLSGGDAQLPLLTRIIVGISDFFTSYLGIALSIGFFAGMFFLLKWLFTNEKGIKWKQERELYLPSVGIGRLRINFGFISKLLIARQASLHLTSLGQVMKATDLVTALNEVADGSPHLVYQNLFETMAKTIEQHAGGFAVSGRPYGYLLSSDFYPLMKTGAQGDMSEQVLKLADQLDEEYRKNLKRLMQFITPATIVFLGLTIGTTVIAMYLPMLDLIGKMATQH